MINNIKRRSFFKKAGLAGAGLYLISVLPSKLFSNRKTIKKFKLKIHPNAVKRNG